MDVVSLGYRTDLALLRLGGSTVEDRGDHLVVRSPHNPTFWWGNFVLLAAPPSRPDADRALLAFTDAFPGADHVAIGVDGTDGDLGALRPLLGRGLTTETSTVMTAGRVHLPPRPNDEASYRLFATDDDWEQSIELEMTLIDEGSDAGSHREFLQRRAATYRELTHAGHGGWFGAFLGDRLGSHLGLLTASPGLARFQTVATHPDARGQGLAGTLVHHASRYGLDELGATTLVMVADPTYVAIRVYQSVGFAGTETQQGLQRRPAGSEPE